MGRMGIHAFTYIAVRGWQIGGGRAALRFGGRMTTGWVLIHDL